MYRQEWRSFSSPFLPVLAQGSGVNQLLYKNVLWIKWTHYCNSCSGRFLNTRLRHVMFLLLSSVTFLLLYNYRSNNEVTTNPANEAVVNDTQNENGIRVHNIMQLEKEVQSKGLRNNKNADIRDREEGVMEKIKYILIKGFIKGVINSHTKRLAKIRATYKSTKPVENIDKDITYTTIDSSRKTMNRNYPRRTLQARISRKRDVASSFNHNINSENCTNYKNYKTKIASKKMQKAILTGNGTTRPLPKKILFYTEFFGDKSWSSFLGSQRTDLASCPVANCIFTSNNLEVDDADALIFHDIDFQMEDVPRVRFPHQRYIWLTLEAPNLKNGKVKDNKLKEANSSKGFFNWTSTYHRSSDIFVPYGGLRSIKGNLLF